MKFWKADLVSFVLTVYLSIFYEAYGLSGSSHELAITCVITADVIGRVRRKLLLLSSPQGESTLTSWPEDS